MAVVRASHEVAARLYVERVLQLVDPSFLVIFSHPRGQRPKAVGQDYATVLFLSDSAQATPEIETTDTASGPDEFVQDHFSNRLTTFSVSIYADNHVALSGELEDALWDQIQIDANEALGVSILHTVSGISNLKTERDIVFEESSIIDFELTYTRERSTTVPVIENFEVTNNS